jgi:uracil phosphoribosyltransferase
VLWNHKPGAPTIIVRSAYIRLILFTAFIMVIQLSKQTSLVHQWVRELRDINIQRDRMRFRTNLERIGQAAAMEISRKLVWKDVEVETPLGTYYGKELAKQPVVCSILRAGVPLHHGVLQYFDQADSAFVAAYRKHANDGSFHIQVEYISCGDLNQRTLILCDPMLATGASLAKTIHALREDAEDVTVHVVCAIACTEGLEYVQRQVPDAIIWCADIDDELTAKGYIVPGLGDAGDLAFGEKLQQ